MGAGASSTEKPSQGLTALVQEVSPKDKEEAVSKVFSSLGPGIEERVKLLSLQQKEELLENFAAEIESALDVNSNDNSLESTCETKVKRVYGNRPSLPLHTHRKVYFMPLKSSEEQKLEHVKVGLEVGHSSQKMYQAIREHLEVDTGTKDEDEYPHAVDLRKSEVGLPPVQNQGNLGACTSFSIGHAWTYDCMKQKEPDVFTPSHLFIYYNVRKLHNLISKDSGATISDNVEVLEQTGVCKESLWPYVPEKFKIKPPAKCYEEAKFDKALGAYKLDHTNVSQYMAALAKGYIINMGMVVYESFESEEVAKTGKVLAPYPKSKDDKNMGGHAVCVVGYEKGKHWIVMNSWGTDWGDQGFCYLPWEFITSEHVYEAWVITKVDENISKNESVSHQVWWFDKNDPQSNRITSVECYQVE